MPFKICSLLALRFGVSFLHVHADICYHFALTDNNKKINLVEKNCKETGKVVYRQPEEGMFNVEHNIMQI